MLDEHNATIRRYQAYREPAYSEVRSFIEDIPHLKKGDIEAATSVDDLGFSVRIDTDELSGKEYVLVANERSSDRAWGAYVFEKNAPIKYVVTAPHPKFDINSEKIALDLWRRLDNSMLIVAGAHRHAAQELADVAHQPGSLFHQVVDHLAAQGIGHIQIHGFANESAPNKDIILSPGAAQAKPLLYRVGAHLEEHAHFRVGTAWDHGTDCLLGKANIQGQSAKEYQSLFAHLELNNAVRSSPEKINSIIEAIAEESK